MRRKNRLPLLRLMLSTFPSACFGVCQLLYCAMLCCAHSRNTKKKRKFVAPHQLPTVKYISSVCVTTFSICLCSDRKNTGGKKNHNIHIYLCC